MSSSPTKNSGEKVARPYQLRLLDHAIKHNSIIYLPTGSGKTYIALMLIKHFSKELNKPLAEGGKRCVFLCNTVELARQNAKEVANVTNFKVGLFIGDMNVDNWPQAKWESEIAGNQVFVGTSQVFVDMVTHQYLSINNLSCVIMDECHHATKSHPMHRFLSLFMYANQNDLPRVVGLTGVLLKSDKKGDILKPLQEMEAVFRGKIVTVQNLDEFHNVLLYSTSPKEVMVKYPDESRIYDVELQVTAIISNCVAELDNWDMGEKMKRSKGLQSLREPSKLKSVKSLLADFLHQMEDMGLYSASIAIMGAIVQLEVNKRNAPTMYLRNMYRYILTKCELIRHLLVKKINSFFSDDDDDDDMDEADIILNFSKAKLQYLLSYLLSEFKSKKGDEISALVFVQRRYTAKCLYYVIKNFVASHPLLKHIIPEFMVGRTAGMVYTIDTILDSKWNRRAIERFRIKECNLIVCSSVLEEGIDVQACNYVISFDTIKTFSSYVQMKGRARSRESTYAVLCENLKQNAVAQQIKQYQRTDAVLKEYLITRTIDREIPHISQTEEQFTELITPFKTRSGAVLQAEATIMLLHRYCQTLPQDSFTNSQALWSIVLNEPNKFIVSLQLPLQSTVKDVIMSDVMTVCKNAKLSAAFKACVMLYQNGEIDESLLPVTRKKIVESCTETYFSKWKNEEAADNVNLAGTKHNVRDYNKIYPEELIDSLPIPGELAYAYCIKIEPNFRLDEDNANIISFLNSNSNFAIVVRKKLPALAPIPLFMTQGPLEGKILSEPFEFIISDHNELLKLKAFNKMIFSDIRKYWKRFLGFDNKNGPNSYLIAPVQHGCSIDWELVRQFQKLTPMRKTTESERMKKTHNPEDYLGKVVSTWYSADENIRYIVTKIRHDLTPLSEFPTNSFKNYAEYVENKYRERVVNTNQFMIEVQPLTSRSNFFINSSGKTTESKRMKRDSKILVIPEMCHNFRFPGDLWLKALFLPCILHRLHYLLNAEKLRVDINRYLGIPANPNYKPAKIEIDYSLRRVGTDGKEPKSMLPALETTRRDNTVNPIYNLVDIQQGNWKAYLEPIDVYRNINTVYPIEIDYYYQFVNNLLNDMDNLKLDDSPEVSMRNLEAHKPKVTDYHFDELTKRICDVSLDSFRRIKILENNNLGSGSLKTAEQFEFLAAITTAKTNDYFDMERFEVLGDSFLKFSSSLLLMHRHQNWNEGYLTAIKSRMVSNRNLLYCMRAKFSGTFICSSAFEPTSEWLPPLSSVPSNILNAIEHDGLSPNCLYEVNLSEEEINSGLCNTKTLESLCDSTQLPETSVECLYEFIYKQSIADKVIADCLEALLGVCVKNYGVQKSFEMLDYFGIFYDADKALLPKLLEINLGSPLLKTNVKQSVIDGYLLNYEYLEKNLKYQFKDRAYLLQALTHPSYPTNRVTGCYQQLEFLGDAILDFLISCHIFERCTHMNPGEITDLRSALVNNVTLACVCVRNRFHQYILYESPTLSESIRKFVEFQKTQDHRVTAQVKILLEETVVEKESFNLAQNIDVPKALGDILEALIGAVFLDSGKDLRCTWNVISQLMEIELNEFIAEVPIDPVRQLYEYKGAKPEFQQECVEYDVVMVKCQFYCRDTVKTVIGCGGNKNMAKKAAAKMALQILHSN